MWIKKVIGFIAGFLLSFLLLALISSGMGFVPRGAGWLLLMIGCGVLVAKLVSNPRFYGALVKNTTIVKSEGIRKYWWSFESKTRVLLLASCAWIFLTYFVQDSYERNLRIVLLPPIVMFGLYLAINYIGKDKN